MDGERETIHFYIYFAVLDQIPLYTFLLKKYYCFFYFNLLLQSQDSLTGFIKDRFFLSPWRKRTGNKEHPL